MACLTTEARSFLQARLNGLQEAMKHGRIDGNTAFKLAEAPAAGKNGSTTKKARFYAVDNGGNPLTTLEFLGFASDQGDQGMYLPFFDMVTAIANGRVTAEMPLELVAIPVPGDAEGNTDIFCAGTDGEPLEFLGCVRGRTTMGDHPGRKLRGKKE